MVKPRFLPLIILLLLSFTPIAFAQEGFEELWSIESAVTDLDVSKDGSRVVMINSTGAYCFDSESQELIWNFTVEGRIEYRQIVTSADGGGTVVLLEGFIEEENRFGIMYLNSTGDLRWGFAFKGYQYLPLDVVRLIDVSDDGDYVAAALNNFTGGATEYYPYLLYWNESSTYYSPDVPRESTWYDNLTNGEMGSVNYSTCLDLSDDGSLVAIGSAYSDGNKSVIFYTDADNTTLIDPDGIRHPTSGITYLESLVYDVDVSYDGYSAAAVTTGIDDYNPPLPPPPTLYYWSNVPSLDEESPANWTRQHPFQCVDISDDGDAVVAGTPEVQPCGIHYWSGALTVDNVNDHIEDWTSHEGEDIPDVAVSDSGDIVAATSTNDMIYFIDESNNSLGEFPVGSGDTILEASGDGRIVAVGGSMRSLYVYKLGVEEPVGGEIIPMNNTIVYLLVSITLIASIAIGTKIRQKPQT